jgi:poly-gamma-glutamate capsule biosynthesis protein CapA/YwtB (metallophosphatase superfamily)
MITGKYLVYLLTIFTTLLPVESQVTNKNIPTMAENANEIISESTISIVGDMLMDSSVRGQIDRNGVEFPWEYVKEYFKNDNLTIGNLETSITIAGTKWPDKQYNFRSDPKNLKAMKEAGIEVVSLANNHSLDYGYDGFLDTLNHLDKAKINRVGGGKNKKEALEGIIIEENGINIGVLSFSRIVPNVDWYATSKRSGIVGAYDCHIKEVLERVTEMKDKADILVLSIHWGVELSNTPRNEEIEFAKKLIDAGVDIVMGHHPHVLQGIEIYNGKPIFYSLGNFIFGSKDEITANTMIAQINLKDKDIDNIKIIPCQIVGGRPIPLENEKKIEKIKYMNLISKQFNTYINNDGIIKLK